MSTEKTVVGDKIVTTTVTEDDKYVDWDDIKGEAEPDDWSGETPWESCCGYDHETENTCYRDHEDRTESYTYFNRGGCYGDKGYIIVSDADLYEGPPGCSKQVRFETMERSRRTMTEQLVKWYENGWYVYCAVAKYKDYIGSLGGIYGDSWSDYVKEHVEDCRHEVADEMELDGYIIEDRPEVKQYNPVDAFKDRIHRNLNDGWG